ncbi:lipase family protein [Nocardia mexicana]|uniref:Secretory lipase n=1 Tax=Nocardia mexicana TaxID=279262 RepID=A0A370GK47_9NOCA|nr:lipase family protein [Nocardia mexicana]RDI43596.1 secretory lipase [Nocardia mexicana]
MNDTDFYTAPLIEDGHRPGDRLRLRKVTTPQLPGAGDAWQLVYVSSDTRGELIPASAIVIAPDIDPDLGPGPILVYYPEFRGLGGSCAPSHLLVSGQEPDTAAVAAALERGWTVAVADGEGLGITGHGPHTFLAARAAGHIVLDLARATRRLPDLDTADAPVAAWGYGDGGRAVAVAGELLHGYAPELDLRGVAAGAVASDLGALIPKLEEGPWAVLGFAGVIGLSRAYHHLPLRHVLTDEGRRIAAAAENLTAAILFDQYRQPLRHWCERPDPWNDPMWRYVLARETLAHTAPEVPLHLYHGRDDSIVPVQAGRRVFTDYHHRGAHVTWREYDADHTSTAADAITETLTRLTDYLTRPANPRRADPTSHP